MTIRTFRCLPLCFVLLFAVALSPSLAQQPFEDGANVLFAGHSFFIPIARNFETLAQDNNFANHSFDSVFYGGRSGSPAELWDDTDGSRTAVESRLAAGNVQLFGLTAYDETNSSLNDYVQWFDLALSYNPDTQFFVGVPWVTYGVLLDTETYHQQVEAAAAGLFEVIVQLRDLYPNNRIFYIGYGKTAPIMKGMFETGQLPDITARAP